MSLSKGRTGREVPEGGGVESQVRALKEAFAGLRSREGVWGPGQTFLPLETRSSAEGRASASR